MRDRMFNILNLIKAKGSCIEDFQEDSRDGSFELKTPFSKYDHRTWLKYELTDDGEKVRMELTHLFGYLDFSGGADPSDLLHLFSMNIPSFQGTSAYLGVKLMNDNFFASLNAAPIFSAKSSDADIAGALWTQLFDLIMGLVVEPPPPIKQFGA